METINYTIENIENNTVENHTAYVIPDNVDVGAWLKEMSERVNG
jgi:hypothetical protein